MVSSLGRKAAAPLLLSFIKSKLVAKLVDLLLHDGVDRAVQRFKSCRGSMPAVASLAIQKSTRDSPK